MSFLVGFSASLKAGIQTIGETARSLGSGITKIKEIPDRLIAVEKAEKSFLGVKETFDPETSFMKDVSGIYQSSYLERLQQTPRNSESGKWLGERGESCYETFNPKIKELLNGKNGVEYRNAIPNFSPHSYCDINISNMSEDRYSNFKQCDELCAKQWSNENFNNKNDWTARDVKDYRQQNNLTWHECNNMKTCQLIPTEINANFGHLGGVSECKKMSIGDGFDE